MAKPSIPSSYNVQTANGQVYLSWANVLSATSYDVQRSLDGVNYASVATVSNNDYLDTAVDYATQYFYKVSAVNSDGASAYTQPQSAIPTQSGEESLASLRLQAQQRADRVNSDFVKLPEWNKYINQSLFELYDLLVTQYGEEYFANSLDFATDGVTQRYLLPNGVNYNAADPFYKLLGVDLSVGLGNTGGLVTLDKFNFIDRNKYFYPTTGSSAINGVFSMSYRLVGNTIEFIPLPVGQQQIRLWYVPRMRQLLKDTDVTAQGVSGWTEYVIVDAAIKALQKEESDVSVLAMQKQALMKRIEAASMNRDAGRPDTISDVRTTGWSNDPSWFKGGF